MLHQWQVILLCAAALALLIQLFSAIRGSRERKRRDALRKLELVLQPRETVKVICPQKKGRVILTSTRILFETRAGFTAVPVKHVKKLRGTNSKGNRTTVPANMVSLTICADQEYTIHNTGDEFLELVKLLQRKMNRRSEVKKQGAE